MSSLFIVAQDQQIANDYFRKGEYEKAASIYTTLYTQNNFNASYLNRLVYCEQQLENYETCKILLENHLEKYPSQIQFYVELGYNYQLQYDQEQAELYYKKTITALEENPVYGYAIGRAFQKNHILDYALQAYQISMNANPNANYELQIATIYGEKGDVEKMFNTYLDLVNKEERYEATILRYVGNFITDDAENEYNILFKKLVLQRTQINQKNVWNKLLSWVFVQQKQYSKAFIQEKALYKRTDSLGLFGIKTIGELAYNKKEFKTVRNVYTYILKNSESQSEIIDAKLYLLFVDIESIENLEEIDVKFQNILNEYGWSSATLNIQLAYANFLTFKKNDTPKALITLENALEYRSTPFQKGLIKLKLGDVLVFNGQFNQALIYYSQVQTSLKNHLLSQEAQFKVAKTSFYKGDFDWAETQLKVLKGSTSQLIANDALELSLIISDNSVKDSLKTALKLYAKSDLLAYQNKNLKAIDTLNLILTDFKGHAIEDEALLKQAELYVKTDALEKAITNYLKIIEINPQDILVDNAHYQLAEIYLKQNNLEKAKEYYQKIIFDFPSSIYLVDARNKYRNLRGDAIQ
ncbi:MAG: tetratricopeptide repeat protein [Urechidicola sp.]|nr:tetratricopeptide repeat protein [Urechidicola sp.]